MADKITVTALVPENKTKNTPQIGPASVTVENGKTAKEQIELFGDAAVKSNADAHWVVVLQGAIRSGLRKGETPEQIQSRLGSAKMGVATAGVKIDPVQAYLALYTSATPAEQKKMQAELIKRAAA